MRAAAVSSHNPNGVASDPEKPPDISYFCGFMAKAGMRNTSGIDSGTDATPLGLDDLHAHCPRVASVSLRQPRAKIRIPVGDEEPPTPTGLRISARGWRNAVKPTPGQPHQKFHLPQRGCVRAGAEGGAPSETRLGLIPGRTQPRWGWDIRGAEYPG